MRPTLRPDWQRGIALTLLGKDRVYGAPGQVPRYDWPNPTTLRPTLRPDWQRGIALTLLHELKRRGGGLGVAALCGGGGQGDALVVQTI